MNPPDLKEPTAAAKHITNGGGQIRCGGHYTKSGGAIPAGFSLPPHPFWGEPGGRARASWERVSGDKKATRERSRISGTNIFVSKRWLLAWSGRVAPGFDPQALRPA